MVQTGGNAFDNAAAMTQRGEDYILHGNLIVDGTISEGGGGGGFTLPNNVYLKSENFAGSGTVDLVAADASNNTVLNALTGKVVSFDVNKVQKASISATALTLAAGVAYDLSDGSDKNHQVNVVAAGTVYSLTATPTALTFGTTSPAIVLDKAGTYLLIARANLKYNAATFAATRAVTIKLRRTNNTPADLTGGTRVLATGVITTLTYTFDDSSLAVVYTTTNVNDAITLFGDVAVVPTAGSLDAIEANIVAVRLF